MIAKITSKIKYIGTDIFNMLNNPSLRNINAFFAFSQKSKEKMRVSKLLIKPVPKNASYHRPSLISSNSS